MNLLLGNMSHESHDNTDENREMKSLLCGMYCPVVADEVDTALYPDFSDVALQLGVIEDGLLPGFPGNTYQPDFLEYDCEPTCCSTESSFQLSINEPSFRQCFTEGAFQPSINEGGFQQALAEDTSDPGAIESAFLQGFAGGTLQPTNAFQQGVNEHVFQLAIAEGIVEPGAIEDAFQQGFAERTYQQSITEGTYQLGVTEGVFQPGGIKNEFQPGAGEGTLLSSVTQDAFQPGFAGGTFQQSVTEGTYRLGFTEGVCQPGVITDEFQPGVGNGTLPSSVTQDVFQPGICQQSSPSLPTSSHSHDPCTDSEMAAESHDVIDRQDQLPVTCLENDEPSNVFVNTCYLMIVNSQMSSILEQQTRVINAYMKEINSRNSGGVQTKTHKQG